MNEIINRLTQKINRYLHVRYCARLQIQAQVYIISIYEAYAEEVVFPCVLATLSGFNFKTPLSSGLNCNIVL